MAASFSSAALASPPAARPSETSPLLAPNRPSPAASLKADAAAADQNDLQWSFIGPDDGRLHGTRLIVTLLAVWGTNFTFALSTTAVATLSPQIAGHFEHIELSSYIGSVFSFTSVLATPLFGALTTHLSRPATMLLAGVLFAAGNVVCATAGSIGVFLWGRALAGCGGAGILCLSSLITTDLISLRERGYYQGIMMCLFAIGSAIGGPVTGVLAAHTSWRLTFILPCLPILSVALVSLFILLPRPAHHTAARGKTSLVGTMDLGGTTLLGLSVGALLWGLSVKASAPSRSTTSLFLGQAGLAAVGGQAAGSIAWADGRVSGWLGASAAALVGLVACERLRERRGLRVLIPTEVMLQHNVLWTSVSAFLLCLANGAVVYNLPLYFTIVRSLSPTATGLRLLPNSLMVGVGSLLSGHIIKTTGRFRVLGLVSLALPVLSAFAMSRWGAGCRAGGWEEWVDVAPTGLGYSSFLVSSLLAILASVPREHIPKATAINYLWRTLGTTIGMALSASFQQAVLSGELHRRFTGPHSASMISSIVHSKAYLFALPPAERAQAVEAYAVSLRATFLAMAVVGLGALVAAWPIREVGLGLAGERVGGGDVTVFVAPVDAAEASADDEADEDATLWSRPASTQ